jgi:hypothetical protein
MVESPALAPKHPREDLPRDFSDSDALALRTPLELFVLGGRQVHHDALTASLVIG